MEKIFNKDKKKDEIQLSSAPDSPETSGELKYIDEINNKSESVAKEKEEKQQAPQIREIPRCMSQTQINNLIINIDMKLNYIISKIEE